MYNCCSSQYIFKYVVNKTQNNNYNNYYYNNILMLIQFLHADIGLRD